jgi:hypothetical protein
MSVYILFSLKKRNFFFSDLCGISERGNIMPQTGVIRPFDILKQYF